MFYVLILLFFSKIGIINEQLYISALTPSHTRRYYMQLNKTKTPPAATIDNNIASSSTHSASTMPINIDAAIVVDLNTEQNRMLQQFMLESGMKPDWAKKCLQDQQWNYADAAQVFGEMKKHNLIPVDAFR